MTYGTLRGTKERCGIEEDSAEFDNVLTRGLAFADSVIDALFATVSQTVPTTTPQLITEAANEIAAYYFIRDKQPEDAKEKFDHGLLLANLYIDAHYRKSYSAKIESTRVS